MTSAICISELEEISFVNIISLSELKLQRNFEILSKAIEGVLSRLDHIDIRINYNQKSASTAFENLTKQIGDTTKDIDGLKEALRQNQEDKAKSRQATSNLQEQLREFKEIVIDMGNKVQKMQGNTRNKIQIVNQQLAAIDKKVTDVQSQLKVDFEHSFSQMEERISSMSFHRPARQKSSFKQQKQAHLQHRSLHSTLVDTSSATIEQFATLYESSSVAQQEHQKKQSILKSARSQEARARLEQQMRALKEGIAHINLSLERNGISDMIGLKGTIERLQRQQKETRIQTEELKQKKNTDLLVDKIKVLGGQCFGFQQKIGYFEDKLGSIEKKLDYQHKNVQELGSIVRQNDFVKVEARLAGRNSQLFEMIKDLRRQLEEKSSTADLNQIEKRFNQKHKEMSAEIYGKSTKSEVKKALQYIESKLKEIVLVVLNEETQEKEALLSKKSLKCASCDKETDKAGAVASSETKNWNMLPAKAGSYIQRSGKAGMSRFGTVLKDVRRVQSSESAFRTRGCVTPKDF